MSTVICTDTVQTHMMYSKFVILFFYISEAPPVRLKKYTYKQVFDMVNSPEGNDYAEVLTLTMVEKDKQREAEKEREEARAAHIETTAPPTKKRKLKGKKTTESGQNMSQTLNFAFQV